MLLNYMGKDLLVYGYSIFHQLPQRFSRYSCSPPSYGQTNDTANAKCLPDCRPGMPWQFTLEELFTEMKRQNTDVSHHEVGKWIISSEFSHFFLEDFVSILLELAR